MSRLLVVVVVACTAAATGAVTASWWSADRIEASRTTPPSSFDNSAPVDDRLAALESALDVERQARQLLQEEVFVLNEALDSLQARSSEVPLEQVTVADVPSEEVEAERGDRRSRAERRAARREQRLLASGFTAAEVEWITRRESELQMEALQSRYAARRAGETTAGFARGAAQAALREELGEASYERYLEASGRPTRVAISNVYEGSPALAAGLRPGDEIVRYDGQRVFGMDEITSLTLNGAVGEPVSVDVLRDGVLMQVSMPRGPLGITGGRRFRR